ncbi:hypothetical protein SGPA1_21445 [Streptomyces misionensis JCM 4497]
MARRRTRRAVSAAHRPVQGDRHLDRHLACGTGHAPGAGGAADRCGGGPVTTLLVIAKEPRAGGSRRGRPRRSPRPRRGADRGGARRHPVRGGGGARVPADPGAGRDAGRPAAAGLRGAAAVRGRPGRAAGGRLRALRRPGPADRHGHPAGHPGPAHRGLRGLRRPPGSGRGRRLLGAGPGLRASRLDLAGLAGPGTAPRGVVVGCHGSAMSPSSALRCTAPDPAP